MCFFLELFVVLGTELKFIIYIDMFTTEDLNLFAEKGIDIRVVEDQLASFKRGFPFLKIASSASVGNGILALDEQQAEHYLDLWEGYLKDGHKVVKFVPASGAASRMFKDLFAFLSADYNEPETDFEKKFFDSINHFAFYADLDAACRKNEGKGIADLMAAGNYKVVVSNLLEDKGLNYGALPKGLLKFHHYTTTDRTGHGGALDRRCSLRSQFRRRSEYPFHGIARASASFQGVGRLEEGRLRETLRGALQHQFLGTETLDRHDCRRHEQRALPREWQGVVPSRRSWGSHRESQRHRRRGDFCQEY